MIFSTRQLIPYARKAVFLSLLLFGLSTQLVNAGDLSACLNSVSGLANNCVANDGSISGIELIEVADGCVNSSDTASVRIDVGLNGATSNIRYDVGVFLNLVGGSAQDDTGATDCFHEALFPTELTKILDESGGLGGFSDRDGDSCGEVLQGQPVTRTLVEGQPPTETPVLIDVACADLGDGQDPPGPPNGYLDINACVGYQQNGNQVCTTVAGAVNIVKSKCSCTTMDTLGIPGSPPVGIPDLGVTIECDPPVVGPGDTVSCIVTYTNGDPTIAGDRIEFRIDDDKGNIGSASSFSTSSGSDTCSVNSGTGTVTFTPTGSPVAGNIVGGASETCTFDYTVPDTTPDGTFITHTVDGWFIPDNSGGSTYPDANQAPALTDSDITRVTAAIISSFSLSSHGNKVQVEWETAVENGTAGFFIERWDNRAKKYFRVNSQMLPGLLESVTGGSYAYIDTAAKRKGSYRYRLVEIESNGNELIHGPYKRSVSAKSGSTAASKKPKNKGFAKAARKPGAKQVKIWKQKKKAREAAASISSSTTSISSEAGNGARVLTREEGMHYLPLSSLTAPLGVSSQPLQNKLRQGKILISYMGVPISYLPTEGYDGLYFYSDSIDSNYTYDNVYQVSLAEKDVDRVMEPFPGEAPDTPAAGQSFPSKVSFEQDTYLVTYAVKDPVADVWFGGFISTGYFGNTDYSVSLDTPGKDSSGTAKLRVWLQGATNLSSGNDHHGEFHLKGQLIGETRWDGVTPKFVEIPFDQSLLDETGNTFRINGVLDSGVAQSSFLIDRVELVYQRQFTADQNVLKLRSEGRDAIAVSGFDGADIMVFDISNHHHPRPVKGASVSGMGAGYGVTFDATSGSEFVAIRLSAAATPYAIEADSQSSLRDSDNAADYLVISPASLMPGARVLVSHRQPEYQTKLVDLQDIYDEFSFGVTDANAIHEFLTYVKENWTTVPRFVVLAGKGTLDPKDINKLGTNVLPVMLASTPYGVFASDVRMADVQGNDGVAEFAIGRIPVLTSGDLSDYVNKLSSFESEDAGDWSNRALIFTDNADGAGKFPTDGDALLGRFPADVSVTHLTYENGSNVDEIKTSLIFALNAGNGFFNYIGHAAPTQLGNEAFLDRDTVDALVNGNKLPVFSAFTCYVGNGSFPGLDSMTEHLLWNTNGGAVAAYTPTGMSVNDQAVKLDGEFIRALYDENLSVGEAAINATAAFKAQGGSRFMREIYNVYGDPALTMH